MPNFLAPGAGFMEDDFSTGDRMGWEGAVGKDGFSMIQANCIQAHLLRFGLVPNRPGPVLVCGLSVGGPCSRV